MSNEEKPVGRLASGPIRRWVKGQPRLAATTPAPTLSAGAVVKEKTSFTYNLGVIFRASIVLFVTIFLIGLASWFILVLTVLATPVIGGNVWTVQRIAWVQGEAPINSRMAVMPGKAGTNIGERVVEIVTNYPGASIVDVVATPTENVLTDAAGVLYVNGEKTKYVVPGGVPVKKLGDEYLTICVTGGCGDKGKAVIIPVENSIGKVIGSTNFGNVRDY